MPVTIGLSASTIATALGNNPMNLGYLNIGSFANIKGGSVSGGIAGPGVTVTGTGITTTGPAFSDNGTAVANGQVWRNIGGFTTSSVTSSFFQRIS